MRDDRLVEGFPLSPKDLGIYLGNLGMLTNNASTDVRIGKYHRVDMSCSLDMNIFCQKNNISACKMWFIEQKCKFCKGKGK